MPDGEARLIVTVPEFARLEALLPLMRRTIPAWEHPAWEVEPADLEFIGAAIVRGTPDGDGNVIIRLPVAGTQKLIGILYAATDAFDNLDLAAAFRMPEAAFDAAAETLVEKIKLADTLGRLPADIVDLFSADPAFIAVSRRAAREGSLALLAQALRSHGGVALSRLHASVHGADFNRVCRSFLP